MNRSKLDALWHEAEEQSRKEGVMYTRYHFAALVAAAEREKVRASMKKAHRKMVELVRADEREKYKEALALLQTIHMGNESTRSQTIIRAAINRLSVDAPQELAVAIRARKETT